MSISEPGVAEWVAWTLPLRYAAPPPKCFFCNTALTSTGWVRMTTLSLGTIHHLSSAAVIESLQIFPRISRKKIQGRAENRTRAAGTWSLNATAVLWRSPLVMRLFDPACQPWGLLASHAISSKKTRRWRFPEFLAKKLLWRRMSAIFLRAIIDDGFLNQTWAIRIGQPGIKSLSDPIRYLIR